MEVIIEPLYDSVGLAGTIPDLNALLITSETIAGGNMVKEKREKNVLEPVEMPILEFENIKTKISSTDIRASINLKSKVNLNEVNESWMNLIKNLSIDNKIGLKWWDILLNKYAEDWRKYHIVKHIWKMIELMKEFKVENKLMFELAIWFHDAIYYPTMNTNEEMSVELFKEFANETGIKEIDYVSNIIMSTKQHKVEDITENDVKLFMDFDLVILGAPNDEYIEYYKDIRKEYEQFSDDQFKNGRISVLKSFLDNKEIFFTKDIREKYEHSARENIMNEIKYD